MNSRMNGHLCYVKVDGKVDQEAVAQANRELLGAAVVLVQIDSADVVQLVDFSVPEQPRECCLRTAPCRWHW